jgi:hypothetical protein
MQHESFKEHDLIVEDTNENFEYWLNQPFISEKLKNEIRKSEILLVPQIGFRGLDYPVFPVKTEELFTYLRGKHDGGEKVEICVENENYKEVALHCDLIVIGSFIVTSVAVPILVNLLSSYIKEKLDKRGSESVIKVSLTIENKKKRLSKKITYEGKPDNFNETIQSIKDIWEN